MLDERFDASLPGNRRLVDFMFTPEVSPMDRCVHLMRSNKNRSLILSPSGTFKGYGAYVSIYPMRELPEGTAPSDVGSAVIQLLSICGPTGYHLKEFEKYKEACRDEESRRVEDAWQFAKLTTSVAARKFRHVDVTFRDGRKSWRAVPWLYSSRLRSMQGNDDLGIRIKCRDGAAALGSAVRELFDSEFW